MSETVYPYPQAYKGQEWDELLKAMNAKDVKRTLKATYRKVAGKVKAIVVQHLNASGLRVGNGMMRGIRVRVYPRGSGFMVTVKPHGNTGMYQGHSKGAQPRPVLQYAEDGTGLRLYRHKVAQGGTGRMPAYHFVRDSEEEATVIVERDTMAELERQVQKRMEKIGWQ